MPRKRSSKRENDIPPKGAPGDDPLGEGELIETPLRARALVDELVEKTSPDDPRYPYLLLLRHQVEVDERQFNEARKVIGELEEAYHKLTSPANRIATFLGSPAPGIARIAVGESEYYANIDPRLDISELRVGCSVRINEAYAVVGNLGANPTGPIVKVRETLDDGRLRVGSEPGQITRIVLRGEALGEAPLKPGDEVRLDPTAHVALEHFQKAEVADYYFEKIPEIPWSKIGGQEEAIRLIRDTIEFPLLYPELYAKFKKKPLKGILLYGPPGCGKTLIGKATAYNVAREYSARVGRDVREYFMYISGPRILNMWLGESERMVREIFAAARERAKEGFLVFVFIDEAEAILRTRTSGRYLNISNTVVPQFSAEMDGLVDLDNVVVILTSNRPDYIDPAILRPERIDRKVKVGRPDRKAARDIFAIYLTEDTPLDPALLEEFGGDAAAAREALLDYAVDRLWRVEPETEFLEVHLVSGRVETLYWKDLVSGALIMSAVERAKDFAIRRCIEKGSEREGISREDLDEAIRLEYRENEIFPKSDTQEDWLKLLDYDPENVAAVRPIRPEKDYAAAHRSII